MPENFWVKPMLVGLSMGAFCLSTCFPFLTVFMSSEERSLRKNAMLVVDFIAGRFLGYMAFGLLFGFLGQTLQLPQLAPITDIALILISVLLLAHLLALKRHQGSICLARQFETPNALAMGFLMGINMCPPFLLSITYVFTLHSVLSSLLYFTIFFLVSSVYFLPMIFVGALSRIKEFKAAARFSGVVCAAVFIGYGGYSLVHHLR